MPGPNDIFAPSGRPSSGGGGGRTDAFGIPFTPTEIQFMDTPRPPANQPRPPIPQNPEGTFIPHDGGGTFQGTQAPSTGSSQIEALIAAQQAEAAAREARIAEALSAIQSIFGNRAGEFDRFADTTFNLNRDRLGEELTDSQRNLKFALARAGTLGGSADVDRNAELDRRFDRGVVDARSFADDQAAQLRAQEQAAASNLAGLASSGNVSGSQAASLSQGAIGATQAALQNPIVQPNLGADLSGISDVIGQALFAVGQRRGAGQGVPFGDEQFNSFFPRGQGRREEGTIS